MTMLAAPRVIISADEDLNPASAWQESLARNSDVQAIVGSLLIYAAADAASLIKQDKSKVLLPRRIGGAMAVWHKVRPRVAAGKHRDFIDAWMIRRATDMADTFDRLHWGNNLDAAGAFAIWMAADAVGDTALKARAVAIARRCLDQIDGHGFFVKEVKRPNNEKAEYYAHESMIFLVELAQRVPELWDLPGKAGGDPAILRGGRLLDADLGNGAHYAKATGKPQIKYPSAAKIGTMAIPNGYLGRWMGQFIDRYGDSFPKLAKASDFYSASPARLFNATVGGSSLPRKFANGPERGG